MYVLDTDVAIEYLRGEEEIVEKILSLDQVYTTVITVSELFYGCYKSENPQKHLKKLTDFVQGIGILDIDIAVCQKFGELKSSLVKKGKIVGDFDILIASICLRNKCHLLTMNTRHYQEIEGLKIYGL